MPYGQASAVSAGLNAGHGIASAWFSEHAAQAVDAAQAVQTAQSDHGRWKSHTRRQQKAHI